MSLSQENKRMNQRVKYSSENSCQNCNQFVKKKIIVKLFPLSEKLFKQITEEEIVSSLELIKDCEKKRSEKRFERFIDTKNFEEMCEIRAQMIDWLVVVCTKLSLSDQTFFLTIEILDEILENYKFQLSLDDIHLITIASLFLSSKNEDVKPLKMKILLKNIGHGKYSKSDILSAELLILSKLHYKLPRNNFVDFMMIILNLNFPQSTKCQCYYKDLVYNYSKSLYKFTIMDFQFKRKINIFTHYSSIAYFSILSVNKLLDFQHNFMISKFMQYVEEIFEVNVKSLLKTFSYIKSKKTLFDNNCQIYPYLFKEEFEKFSI
jgi:hypothetical protein